MPISEIDILKAYEYERNVVANDNNTFGSEEGRLAYAYIRCSSKAQLQGSSLGRQIKGIHYAAEQWGYCIPFNHVYAECCSAMGVYTNQHKLIDLLHEAETTQYIIIFCEDNDRLSRDESCFELLTRLQKANSRILFVRRPMDYFLFEKYRPGVTGYVFNSYDEVEAAQKQHRPKECWKRDKWVGLLKDSKCSHDSAYPTIENYFFCSSCVRHLKLVDGVLI